jgi:long-subunit fatty acid transport protein
MKRYFLSVVAVIIVSLNPLKAQQHLTNQQFWLDGYWYLNISDKLQWENDLGIRHQFYQRSIQQYNIRSSLAYRFYKNFQLLGGVIIQYNELHNERNGIEYRPWQGLKHQISINKSIKLSQQVKLEERFFTHFHYKNTEFGLRFRYELSTNIPLLKSGQLTSIYLPVSDEYVRNIVGEAPLHLVNLNRLNVGLGYSLNQECRLELVFMRQTPLFYHPDNIIIDSNMYRVKWKQNL